MPRLASGGSPPAAWCAAGPRTRRDGRTPGLPARAAIYPRRITHGHAPRATTRDGSTPSFWRGKAAPLPAGAPGRATAHAPSHLKLDFAHYSVPHLALFSHLFT